MNEKDFNPVSSDHLGTREEILDFSHEMAEQLWKHKGERKGLRDVPYREVRELTVDELLKRIPALRDGEMKAVNKQCVHIANFVLFLWLKSKGVVE